MQVKDCLKSKKIFWHCVQHFSYSRFERRIKTSDRLDKTRSTIYNNTENTTGGPALKPAESGMEVSLTLIPDTDNAVVGSLRQMRIRAPCDRVVLFYIRL